MIISVLALTAAIAFEVAGAWQLGQFFAAAQAPWTFVALHLTASTVAAGALFNLLPEQYQDDTRSGVLFLFMVTLTIPLLGMLGLGLGLLPALWRQRSYPAGRDLIRAKVTSCLPPCSAQAQAQAAALASDGCLMGTLLGARTRECRVRALISTLSLDASRSLPLLRIGLRDADDDVRLLSYALISRKEKSLEASIASALRRLEQAPDSETFGVHRALARDYWELAGLANDGGAVAFLLERARLHTQAAARIHPREADVQFLLGRILLKTHDLEAARAAFLRAASAGVALDRIGLFLAEIAFHRQQLDQVVKLIRMEKRAIPFMLAVRLGAYWGGNRER